MTTPRIILRRANSSVANTYSGAIGEITYDTESNTIRVYTGSASLTLLTSAGTANNTQFVGNVSAANVVSNSQLQANLLNYVTNSNFVSNLSNYQTTAGLASNVATLAANTANNASYLGGVAASNYTSTGKAIAMAIVFGG